VALRNIGSLWKPKKDSKAVASGFLELGAIGYLIAAAARGEEGRIVIFRNETEGKKEKAPDFRLCVSFGDDERKEGGNRSGGSDEPAPF
jgi:hypothetical protein